MRAKSDMRWLGFGTSEGAAGPVTHIDPTTVDVGPPPVATPRQKRQPRSKANAFIAAAKRAAAKAGADNYVPHKADQKAKKVAKEARRRARRAAERRADKKIARQLRSRKGK